MKILCESQVIQRGEPTNRGTRFVKSTLALGYKQNKIDKEIEMVRFTQQNKNGTRFKIRDNIFRVFTKYIYDGKATISFKEPPEDLFINCDPIQLKSFLMTLKLGIEGKESINLQLNVATATAIPTKSQPQQRMSVNKRSEYPLKGFPRQLKNLSLINLGMQNLGFDICQLQQLTVLNITNNLITELPEGLGTLSLTELNVSENELGTTNKWTWLVGDNLRKSLRELDMSTNKLTYLPKQLVKFENLVTLKLNTNKIKRLPFSMRRLQKLRYMHIAGNALVSLPDVFDDMPLDTLDIWGNKFAAAKEFTIKDLKSKNNVPTSLWLQAARVVCQSKLYYDSKTLPWTLVEFMAEAPICACGRLCYENRILDCAALARFCNLKSLVFSRDRHVYLDIVVCGTRCAGRRKLNIFLETTD